MHLYAERVENCVKNKLSIRWDETPLIILSYHTVLGNVLFLWRISTWMHRNTRQWQLYLFCCCFLIRYFLVCVHLWNCGRHFTILKWEDGRFYWGNFCEKVLCGNALLKSFYSQHYVMMVQF
jgi:hypothetical protein